MRTFNEWMEKYGPIPEGADREIAKQIKKITKLEFKKKQGEYKAGDYEMSIRWGIFVLQGGRDIPKFDEVIKYLKTQFGDIHIKGKVYINARGYGVPYQDEPEGTIEAKIIHPLPNVVKFIEERSGKRDQREVLAEIGELLETRKVKIVGSPKVQKISQLDVTEQLVKHKDILYVISIGDAYQVSDEKDAENLMGFMRLKMRILRNAEIQSWRDDDMSNPYGGK